MTTTVVPQEAALFKASDRVKTDRMLEFYAAAFTPDAPDSYGDVIDPNAFDGWLPEFYAKGQALRISFNHAAVLDPNDPTNVVGYAPAAPSNVWVDDYGLRIKGFLDVTTEKGKAVEYQVENGLLTGASLAYFFKPEDRVKQRDHFLLKRIRDVTEAGLVPSPANQAAVLLWMKSEGMLDEATELPYMTVDEFRETLLHEPPADEPPSLEEVDPAVLDAAIETLKHANAASYIQKAHDALVRYGAKCATSDESTASTEATASDDETEFTTKLRLIEASLP